jgi:NAD(P)-dependent dehydrogenase (short-subunit alcohol dehydrogenase family)
MAVLVTGGSSGIGRAIAERFAASGHEVFVNYRSDDARAAAVVEAIRARGGQADAVKADVGDVGPVRGLIAAIAARTDRLDCVVHCAVAAVPGPLSQVAAGDFARSIEVNGASLVHLVREASPLLGDGSSVLFVTSRGSRSVVPGYGALGVAKSLADGAVRYLAAELAPRGIRVNALSPGALDTPALRAMLPDDWELRLQAAASAIPAGRTVTFDEVGRVAEALSRPEFAMLQGQVIVLDGGASL